MVKRSALIREIDSLSPRCYTAVIDFVGYIKEKEAKKLFSLEKAADMAAEEYRSNKELTTFCVIDSEDFYETR